MALNPAQGRAVVATFSHVSELLDGIQRMARGEASQFDGKSLDLTEAERERLAELVAVMRDRMLRGLACLDLAPPPRDTSARWAVRTTLLYADVALSELSPTTLSGFGVLDDRDAEAVLGVVGDLRRILAQAMRGAVGPRDDATGQVSADG